MTAQPVEVSKAYAVGFTVVRVVKNDAVSRSYAGDVGDVAEIAHFLLPTLRPFEDDVGHDTYLPFSYLPLTALKKGQLSLSRKIEKLWLFSSEGRII